MSEHRPYDAADASIGLLAALGSEAERALEARVRELRLPPGARIFDAGEPSDAIYLVRSGLVDIRSPEEAGAGRLVTLGPGEAFGELGAITGRPRSAGAVAQTGVTLWRLELPDFLALMAEEPSLAAGVARVVSERLQAATRARSGSPRGRTVVIRSTRPAAAANASRTLAAACHRLLGERPLVLAAGPPDVWGRSRLPAATQVLEASELPGQVVRAVREHAMVLVPCTPRMPEALEGADRVVILTDRAETADEENGGRVHVLALDPGKARLEALARELCGRRIGLVLGSGGIRGFAHAGVLRVLHAEGIPVDVYGGASAGGIAAALVLSGWDPEELADLGRAIKETVGTGLLPGLSLSPQALLSGRRLRGFFRKRLGPDTLIEDLATPLVLSATDLETRAAVHLTSGRLADAVSASAAVPGIFPPVTIDGRRLVDGGVSDPVPVDAVRRRGADIVVAVNVMSIGRGPMGVYTPRVRIPMPGPLESLFVGLDTVITQLAIHGCRRADILIEPGATSGKWYEVVPARTYEQAGARAARDALPALRRLLGG